MIGPSRAARAHLIELGGTFLVVFFVLLLLSLGSRFTAYLQDAMVGEVAADALWLMLALRIPEFVQIVSPFSLFLAMLFLVGRIDADSELPIYQAAGLGPARVIGWFSWFVIPLFLIIAFLSLFVTPTSRALFADLVESQELVSELDVLKEKTFRTFNEGLGVTYMREIDRENGKVIGMFSTETKETGSMVSIAAAEGSYHKDSSTDSRYIELQRGHQYSKSSDGEYERMSFERLSQRLSNLGDLTNPGDAGGVATQDLNFSNPAQHMEFHWRIGLPLMTLISALCAIGLGRLPPRSGRYDRFLPGILFLASYYGLSLLAVSQLSSQPQWVVIGLWPVHFLMLGISVYYLRKFWNPV